MGQSLGCLQRQEPLTTEYWHTRTMPLRNDAAENFSNVPIAACTGCHYFYSVKPEAIFRRIWGQYFGCLQSPQTLTMEQGHSYRTPLRNSDSSNVIFFIAACTVCHCFRSVKSGVLPQWPPSTSVSILDYCCWTHCASKPFCLADTFSIYFLSVISFRALSIRVIGTMPYRNGHHHHHHQQYCHSDVVYVIRQPTLLYQTQS